MIQSFQGRRPAIAESAYVHPAAVVIGRAGLGDLVSVWANTTIRADVNSIEIAAESNVQDNCCLHVDRDKPLRVGERVVVGHSVVLHGCTIEDECLIGMGSTVLSGARVGAGSILAAGSLVLEGQEIPPGSVAMGRPARVRREATRSDHERILGGAKGYVELSRLYMEEAE